MHWYTTRRLFDFGKVRFGIMVSIWWIVWAFLIGGYAGMLLVALVVLARKVRAPG